VTAILRALLALVVIVTPHGAGAANAAPIVLAVSAEFGVQGSNAAQSIERGVQLAVDEINARGGVLGGRLLAVEARDDRGVPARAIDNLRDLAVRPDVLAVFCGRFSPVALELAPIANTLKVLLLDPWAAADGIVGYATPPNYVFRLSLTDTWAVEKMLAHARSLGARQVGMILPNTAWGRSSLAAAQLVETRLKDLRIVPYWYNWGDTEFSEMIQRSRRQGDQVLVMVANEAEGSQIVRAMAAQPREARVPIVSHWGITGGNFPAMAGPALADVDLTVVQTFTFHDARAPIARSVAAAYEKRYGEPIHRLSGQVGLAHAYDLTILLARAIAQAGSADRAAVRDALEHLGTVPGLLRKYNRPFAPKDHEALDASQVSLMRFTAQGDLQPIR
jgi:branched-chain amino acid transport system substrate-binding protein